MRLRPPAVLAVLATSACCRCPPATETSPAAASAPSAASAAGYRAPAYAQGKFTVAVRDNHAWFFAPDGERFLSQGVNHIGDSSYRAPNPNYYDPVGKQFGGNKPAWVKSALGRLSQWGFNTVGAWSDDALYGQRYPYTYMLYAAGYEHPLDHVFDADFESIAAQNTEKARARKNDPYLIGYFLDNELPWWGEFGWHASDQKSLLERYARTPAGNAGKAALRDFLKQRYAGDIAHFNRAYRTSLASFDELGKPLELAVRGHAARRDADEFAGIVADRFFSVTTRALRERDPNHLQLCVRFAGEVPWPVVRVAARYCDVISVNQYQASGDINRGLLDDFYAASHKPILLTEYSFSATENQSGDPNTKGAMVTVRTQQERAEHAARFANQALALPYLVGLHWFEWADESPQGRFDGEDQNYGLVDIHDATYALLTQAQQRVNGAAQLTHERSRTAFPSSFQGDREASLHRVQPPRTLPAALPFFDAGQKRDTPTWGDAANSGNAQVEARAEASVIRFDSGSGWGAGVSFLPPVSPFDASGAEHLELTLQLAVGQHVQVLLSESGAAAPGQASYSGQAGSDGESYEFPALTGTGKLETYVIDLNELDRRTSWGNQRGNLQLDLQALVTVDLYLPGKQGNGELRLVSMRFTR